MSEQAIETAAAGEQNEQGTEASKFEAITSQEDFDKAIQARIARERAKFADYEDLKAKAARVDELTAELDSVKTDLDAERAGSVRARVAAAKGVPEALLSGATQEELESSADALIDFRGEKSSKGLLVPNEGKSPTVQVSDEKEFVGNLFGGD